MNKILILYKMSTRQRQQLADAAAAPTEKSAMQKAGQRSGWIVTSDHLVSDKSPELSELAFGMTIAWHAFARWTMRCRPPLASRT